MPMWDIQMGALIGALITAALAGFGWLVRRKLMNDPARERTALYASLAELSAKLKDAGLSLEDVRVLEASLFSSSQQPSAATLAAVTGNGPEEEDGGLSLPPSYWSTMHIKARTNARMGVLDNELEEALTHFAGLWSQGRRDLLRETYEAWYTYRCAEARLAGLQFEGGTFQPIAETIAAIALSEAYLDRLRQELKAAKALASCGRSPASNEENG